MYFLLNLAFTIFMLWLQHCCRLAQVLPLPASWNDCPRGPVATQTPTCLKWASTPCMISPLKYVLIYDIDIQYAIDYYALVCLINPTAILGSWPFTAVARLVLRQESTVLLLRGISLDSRQPWTTIKLRLNQGELKTLVYWYAFNHCSTSCTTNAFQGS